MLATEFHNANNVLKTALDSVYRDEHLKVRKGRKQACWENVQGKTCFQDGGSHKSRSPTPTLQISEHL